MKNLLFFCLLLPIAPGLFAQTAMEAPEPFQRGNSVNAVSIVLTGQPKNVAAVLNQKINAATRQKSKPWKGLTLFAGVRYPAISPITLDLYYRVEKASRSEDALTKATVFLSSGGQNFLNSRSHPEEIANLKGMMEALPFEVRKYELQLAIQEQQKVVDREIRDHDKMVRDSVTLEKTLADTQKAIEDNKVSRANQVRKIEDSKTRKAELERALREMDEDAWEPERRLRPTNRNR